MTLNQLLRHSFAYMRLFKITTIAAVVVIGSLFSGPANAEERAFKKINGRVFVRTVELTNSSGDKILILGTVHLAPQSFYDRLGHIMMSWSSDEPTTILKEFSTCHGEVYDKSRVEPSSANLTDASEIIGQSTQLDFIRSNGLDVQTVIQKLSLAKTSCINDVDGKTKRPPYIVERNRRWCDKAPSLFKSCQWLGLNYPNTPNVRFVEADTVMDQVPVGLQIVGVQMYRPWENIEYIDDPSYEKFYSKTDFVILSFRNSNLVHRAVNAFADGAKKVIIPWGAGHTAGLVALFTAENFQILRSSDLLYISSEDPAAKDDGIFNDPSIGPGY